MARIVKTKTVTMSDEAWTALRLIAEKDLRTQNAQLEFILLEVAKSMNIPVAADA